MKKILLLFALFTAPAFAQIADTCRVFMQLYDYTGAPARNATLTISRMVVNGYNITIPGGTMPVSDGSGVVQFRAFKNATVWLYASQVAGLDTNRPVGRQIALSSAATQWIVPISTASVPARHIVTTSDLYAGKSPTLGFIDSLIFSGAGVTVSKAFGKLTVDIAGGSGGTSAYGDSIHVADSIARAAVTVAQLRDSLATRALAVGDSLARHYLRLGDSLTARTLQLQSWVVARAFMAASDSTIIHQRAHTWTARQRYIATLANGDYTVPILLQGWTNPNAGYGLGIQRNDFGANQDYTFRIGYNPYRELTSEPELVLQFEHNYFNSDSLLEWHLSATGQNGSSSRWLTAIGRRSTGRGIDIGFNTARVYFGDTLGVHPAFIRIDSPSRTIDFDTSAGLRWLQANQAFITAYNGTSYVGVLGSSGNTTLTLGGSGWTTATKLTSGTETLDLQGANNKLQTSTTTWSGTAGDSLNVATKGYVDTRIAGLSGASVADSAHTAGRYTMGVDSIATTVIDWQASNLVGKTISAPTTFTFSNLPTGTKGQFLTVRITSTGAYSVGWPSTIAWEGGIPAQAASGTTTYSFYYDATYGTVRGMGYSVGVIPDSITAFATAGPRGISSTARMFVSDDSITFVGEAGDVIDASTGNVFRGTIGANDTLSVSNIIDGQILTVIITNASTYTLGWTGVNWTGGTAPTLSAAANKRDVFTLIRAGGIMYGSYVQDLR